MHKGRLVFSQLLDYLPRDYFEWLVKRYEGNKYVKTFSCWNHLLVLLFGQLSNRESLRDLIMTIAPHKRLFHHLGFGKNVSRSNLSKANETRDVRIFKSFAERMITLAREKRAGKVKKFFLDKNLYAFDSTTISLCLSLFWWTKLHQGKSGVKMHTLYDVKTDVPAFVIITSANIHDSRVMGEIPYEAGSIYVFDRAYMDTKGLYVIETAHAFFVVREQHKLVYEVVEDKNYNNPMTGVMADQIIEFRGYDTRRQYPKDIRRVVFYDKERNWTFVFYTNNMEVSAKDIALSYKYRWRCELFFKWLKQHLRVKEFYGTSENAVRIQLYVAITAYCLITIIEHDLHLEMDTYDILRILSTSLIVKMPLTDLLDKKKWGMEPKDNRQLYFDF